MRMNVSKFKNWELHGPEGRIGAIQDVLVDDDRWSVRYLVVAIDGGLIKRKVLLDPKFITETDGDQEQVSTYLQKETVANNPRLEWVQPISRQYREALTEHFGSLAYRIGTALLSPQQMMQLAPKEATTFVDESSPASLRSLKEMLHYKVIDQNGATAKLSDICVNATTWSADHATTRSTFGSQEDQNSIPMNRLKNVDWSSREMRLDGRTLLKPTMDSRLEQAWGNLSLNESAIC